MTPKIITFLFPRTGEHPIGGFKVVYEYANRLANDGYKIRIIYSIASYPVENPIIKLGYLTVRWFRYIKYKYKNNFTPENWFDLNPQIEQKLIFLPKQENIGSTDIIFATSWVTSIWVDKYSISGCAKKFYLIQALEDWHGNINEMLKTWKLPLRKLVIALWLQRYAEKLGQTADVVPNGLNFERFYVTIPIEEKDKHTISMLWHDDPFKACGVGLQAIKIVKEKYPQLKALFFGVPTRPKELPLWIEYYHIPDEQTHRDIYNKAAIFAGPSTNEGLGLTVPEAMMCGAAVACTDNDGYKIMAHHHETALLCEINNPSALASNIIKLIEDDSLRHKLAHNGVEFVKPFTWSKSYEILKKIIE